MPVWPAHLRADVSAARPGYDEITLTIPRSRHLCSDRAHRRLGRLAYVIVIFGQLGDPRLPRECLWRECWGSSYPMCSACWENARQIGAAPPRGTTPPGQGGPPTPPPAERRSPP